MSRLSLSKACSQAGKIARSEICWSLVIPTGVTGTWCLVSLALPRILSHMGILILGVLKIFGILKIILEAFFDALVVPGPVLQVNLQFIGD